MAMGPISKVGPGALVILCPMHVFFCLISVLYPSFVPRVSNAQNIQHTLGGYRGHGRACCSSRVQGRACTEEHTQLTSPTECESLMGTSQPTSR